MMDYDVIVIGSGFGGSVAALRLTQKGYRVAVVEAGRRWPAETLPRSTWDTRKYLWQPALGCYGIQRMDLLDHVFVVSGTAVGGGSIVYGNTLFQPLPSFFTTPIIEQLGGAAGFYPFYELAKKMMGVVANPRQFEPDRLIKDTADELGRAHSFTPSPVGIYFGQPEQTVADPYFGGAGPPRTGCRFCGACFLGCRYGSKNTLPQNYLYFAEKLGATILEQTQVCGLRPLSVDGAEGYLVETRPSGALWPTGRRQLRAKKVVLSAGVLGTLRLLWAAQRRGHLPRLSARLGYGVRTNSEAIIGVSARDRRVDYSEGIAASSSVFPDDHTQIQADRYPRGSDLMALMSTLLVDGGGRVPRPLRWLGEVARHPADFVRLMRPSGFAQRSIILVVMQDLDSRLRVAPKDRRLWPWGWRLGSAIDGESRVPTYIPIANEFARRLAARLDGIALSSLTEVFLDVPTTAHILGGCGIGANAECGVVDEKQRVYGYRGLYVCDGSVIPLNLGVNPALSILAFAERAMSFIPPRQGPSGPVRQLPFERQWGVEGLVYGAAPSS